MGIMKSENIPNWLWRLTLLMLLGAVLTVALLLGLALGGISNTSHMGSLAVRDDLDHDAGWTLQSGDGLSGAAAEIGRGIYRVMVPASQARVLAQAPYLLDPPCTMLIAGRQTAGPTDAGYGLWWGDALSAAYQVVAVNGDGYITVFRSEGGNTQAIMAWQLFPRIHPQQETNTLQVDIDGRQVLVRANDEIVTTFDWVSDGLLEAGFYVETLSVGGTTVDFDWLSIWQVRASQP
jgi:hypothetical protein